LSPSDRASCERKVSIPGRCAVSVSSLHTSCFILCTLHMYRHASANEETSMKLRELLMSWMQEVSGSCLSGFEISQMVRYYQLIFGSTILGLWH